MPSSVHHLFLPQVKKTERDTSGYAKFSNNMNVNMVRYSFGSKAARQKLVDQFWRVKKESEALVPNFTKKGGFKSAWNRSLKSLQAELSSGANGTRGAFFQSRLGAAQVSYQAACVEIERMRGAIHDRTRDISLHSPPSPGVRPWIANLVGPEGADYRATPEKFWLEDVNKRHGSVCHDTMSRSVHEKARSLLDEYLKELLAQKTHF